ncbi:hypothetical protein CDAR_621681 [Caerostris darwini]|uniref:Uncharacterized protein n=1 Tax=Caerostris darwini TaxID=1538125 RepID=A0AAV4P720_9ARAC|nr:hypothetical protein CDAR_621681 [Caerostris darwini]
MARFSLGGLYPDQVGGERVERDDLTGGRIRRRLKTLNRSEGYRGQIEIDGPFLSRWGVPRPQWVEMDGFTRWTNSNAA